MDFQSNANPSHRASSSSVHPGQSGGLQGSGSGSEVTLADVPCSSPRRQPGNLPHGGQGRDVCVLAGHHRRHTSHSRCTRRVQSDGAITSRHATSSPDTHRVPISMHLCRLLYPLRQELPRSSGPLFQLAHCGQGGKRCPGPAQSCGRCSPRSAYLTSWHLTEDPSSHPHHHGLPARETPHRRKCGWLWKPQHQRALLQYRNAPDPSLKNSPAGIVFGREGSHARAYRASSSHMPPGRML